MLDAIQYWAVRVLITSVVILTLIGVLSIWDVFTEDVLWKSISTMILIFFSSAATVVIAKALDKNHPHSL